MFWNDFDCIQKEKERQEKEHKEVVKWKHSAK